MHSGQRFGIPVVHRDIKFENFVMSAERQVKLIDFDDATALPDNAEGEWARRCGAFNYAAPEIYNKQTRSFISQTRQGVIFDPISRIFKYTTNEIDCIYSAKAVDIYALGTAFNKLLFDVIHPSANPLSADTFLKLRILVCLMTNVDPKKRLDITSLLIFMRHCFPQSPTVALPETDPADSLVRAVILPLLKLNLTTALDGKNIGKATKTCGFLSKHQDEILKHQGLKGFEILTDSSQPMKPFREWQCPNQLQSPSPSINAALGYFAPIKSNCPSYVPVDLELCRINLGPVFAGL